MGEKIWDAGKVVLGSGVSGWMGGVSIWRGGVSQLAGRECARGVGDRLAEGVKELAETGVRGWAQISGKLGYLGESKSERFRRERIEDGHGCSHSKLANDGIRFR